jgi:hypothetical protein
MIYPIASYHEMNEISIDIEAIPNDNIHYLHYDTDQASSPNRVDEPDYENRMITSNSPITISEYDSNSNSNSDSNSDGEPDQQYIQTIRMDRIHHQLDHYGKHSFKKKKYRDIETILLNQQDPDNKYSTKLDILITFMKGQKNVFMYAKIVTQHKIYLCMIPVLLFSAAMAIFAPMIQDYSWSGGLISCLNVLITFFVSLLNYMKYESQAEKYLQLSTQYDKLEMSLEMTTGQLLFIENETEKNTAMLTKLREVETVTNDLKDIYAVMVPEEVIRLFPIICTFNIFSMIKKIELYKKTLILRFKDIKNEIRYILYKWKHHLSNDLEQAKEKSRLLFLYEKKDVLERDITECSHIYEYIDELFSIEIQNADHNKQWCNLFCHRRHAIKKIDVHPLLQNHFHFMFEER